MSTHLLARHYDCLTPAERFRRIRAAGACHDEGGHEQLQAAGQRLTLAFQANAPSAHAFQGVALVGSWTCWKQRHARSRP